MDPLILAAIGGIVLLVVVFLVLATWAGFSLGRQVGQQGAKQQIQSMSALNDVMTATATRTQRDLNEALSLILDRLATGVQAASASVHVAHAQKDFRLVRAMNVTDMARFAVVHPEDPILTQLTIGEVHVIPLPAMAPWNTLGNEESVGVMAVASFGRSATWHGLLTLYWKHRREAETAVETLTAAARYAGQVMAEFESIESRAREFQSMNNELERMTRINDVAAHDMGNHLGYVLPMTDLIRQSLPADFEYLSVIDEFTAHLRLVEAIRKEMARSSREIDPVPLSVPELIELIPAMMARRLSSKKILFDMEVPRELPKILGDQISLLRVLDNLLNNAAKYNQPPGHIRLRIQPSGQDLEFMVENTGMTIPVAALPHLFEFGYRVNRTDATVKGHGIGLYSCKQIIDAHRGQLWAESREGINRFYFTVPQAEGTRDGKLPA